MSLALEHDRIDRSSESTGRVLAPIGVRFPDAR